MENGDWDKSFKEEIQSAANNVFQIFHVYDKGTQVP